MSCMDCIAAQQVLGVSYYVRVGNGNIAIQGCKAHVKTLIDSYKMSQVGERVNSE